jgi:hypothetical protein
MTEAYYWRTVGRNDIPEETQKLLDTDEIYEEGRHNIHPVYYLPSDSTILLNKGIQRSPEFTWKEWEYWKMTQFIIRFKDKDRTVKERMIRLHRFLWENNERNIYFDIRQPLEEFDKVSIEFWNAESDKEIIIRNLKAETFDE